MKPETFSRITFKPKNWREKSADKYVAEIEGDVSDLSSLIKILSSALKFPKYFGNNLDALTECLKDFHWISEKEIIIKHDELPTLTTKDLVIYFDILVDAVAS